MEILISDSSLSLNNQIQYSDSDQWGFGKYWNDIKPFLTQGYLEELIYKRRTEIIALKEEWRAIITSFLIPQSHHFYQRLSKCQQTGFLVLIEEGLGGTYFLKHANDEVCFIIKPLDEEILCLNNRKSLATPFNHKKLRVRSEIPLYRSCQTSSAASAIAKLVGLDSVTPNTQLAILSSPLFYTLKDDTHKEKLCSVQEYLVNSTALYTTIETSAAQGMTDEQIANQIDQHDFECACLFVWLCYDNDGHANNFRTYPKSNGLLRLVKIDNNLTFPEKNVGLDNCLSLFPNANKPFSEETKQLILNLPLSKILDTLKFYGLEQTIEAFTQRCHWLQTWITEDKITLKEINRRFLESEPIN